MGLVSIYCLDWPVFHPKPLQPFACVLEKDENNEGSCSVFVAQYFPNRVSVFEHSQGGCEGMPHIMKFKIFYFSPLTGIFKGRSEALSSSPIPIAKHTLA